MNKFVAVNVGYNYENKLISEAARHVDTGGLFMELPFSVVTAFRKADMLDWIINTLSLERNRPMLDATPAELKDFLMDQIRIYRQEIDLKESA
jgi:hypothetical protein